MTLMIESEKSSPKAGGRLHGIVPPLVTPLVARDALDVGGLERLIEHVIGGGVHGLFVLGTTGELAAVSRRLRRELVTRVTHQVAGRVPVVVGVSDTCVTETTLLARHAADCGADAVVVTSPYYMAPDQEELHAYVRTVAQEQPLPVVLYNMPALTKTAYEVETVVRLAELERVVGIKDSSGELAYLEEVARRVGRKDWSLMVGAERLCAAAVRGGLHGCVAGGANVAPRLFVELYDAARGGDARRVEGLQVQARLLDGIYRACGNGVPGAIRGMKTALSVMGICSDRMADPFRASCPGEREEVGRALQELGVSAA